MTAIVAGINADVTIPPLAPVTLPSQGGADNNQVANVFVGLGIPGVITVLSTGLVVDSTSGSLNQSAAHSESTSTVNNLKVLNGLVSATTIRSKSTSDGNGVSAVSNDGGTFANQLRIGGIFYEQSEFAPNTTIAVNATIQATVLGSPVLVPVTGTATINEQLRTGNGATSSSLTVNFLHLSLSGSVVGLISLNADIIVASASSGVNFVATPPPVNHSPVLTVPGPQTVQAGNTLNFSVTATDPDAGDSVALSASSLPQHSSFNQTSGNPANGQFSFTPSASQVGTFAVSFTATDSHGASVSSTVQITVTSSPPPPTNHPPTINVPGPQTIEAGKTLTFIVTASDPDGDAVTLSSGDLPPNASFNAATGLFSFRPVSQQADQLLSVVFTATDTHGASANGAVPISVVLPLGDLDPGPPIISVPPSPIIIQVGSTLVFTVTATSPKQGCLVPIIAPDLPPHATFDVQDNRFSFVPTDDQKDRSFVVTFTGTDCIGQTVTGVVTILVISGDVGGNLLQGRICVPVTKVFFGTASINGSCGFMTVSITNAGAGTLKIGSVSLTDGTHFLVETPGGGPLAIKAAGVIELKILFRPKSKGNLIDTLTIATDDPDQPTIAIALKGKGKQ